MALVNFLEAALLILCRESIPTEHMIAGFIASQYPLGSVFG
jgi:hypothetical protein